MWANNTTTETVTKNGISYSYQKPFKDASSPSPLVPYYTVVKTNRTGIEICTPPGGTQDIMFEFNKQTHYAELLKSDHQEKMLQQLLGMNIPNINDLIFVTSLLWHPDVSNVRLEPAFSAAQRETAEEHGWSYEQNRESVSFKFEMNESIFTKRSYTTTPPKPINQKIFVVEVPDFENTAPARTNKTENKIKERIGHAFYEQGDYLSLSDLRTHLDDVKAQFHQKASPNEADKINLQVAIRRFEIISKIEKRLLSL